MNKIYQQGDVILKLRRTMPKQTKRVEPSPRGYVLAEGEATGHAHVFTETDSVEMRQDEKGVIWVRINEPVNLIHEEHAAQQITPGVYEIDRVVEVDPFQGEIREVRD